MNAKANHGLFGAIQKTLRPITEAYVPFERTKEAPFPKESETGRVVYSRCATAHVREYNHGGQLHTVSHVTGHGYGAPMTDKLESFAHNAEMGKIEHDSTYHVHDKDTGDLLSKHSGLQMYHADSAEAKSWWGDKGFKTGRDHEPAFHPIKVYDKVTGEHTHTIERRGGEEYPSKYNAKTGAKDRSY